MSSSDFYFIYPRSIDKKDKIYNWITKWLSIIEQREYFILGNDTFYNCSLFQIAFYLHGVYYDMRNKKYLWYTMENYHINTDKFIESRRFDTYDEAVREGVEEFYLKWKNNL
jgi:hypothetical protein